MHQILRERTTIQVMEENERKKKLSENDLLIEELNLNPVKKLDIFNDVLQNRNYTSLNPKIRNLNVIMLNKDNRLYSTF